MAVANLNPEIDFGILMTVSAANHAQYLWQAAYRESRQGEGQDYPACVPGPGGSPATTTATGRAAAAMSAARGPRTC